MATAVPNPKTVGAGLTVPEPKLEDVLSTFGRNLKISFNCVKIGIIKSFNASQLTATIQVVFQQQMIDGTYQAVPILTDCPVVMLQGGGYAAQFPVAAGDTALVFFADRNIDNWFQAGGVLPPADGRLHAMSDAVALVGLNSLANPPAAGAPPSDRARLVAPDGSTLLYVKSGDAMMAEAGGAQVEAKSGLVGIRNSTKNLLGVLNDLLAALEALTVTVSGSSGTVSPATVTALQAVGTELAALLSA